MSEASVAQRLEVLQKNHLKKRLYAVFWINDPNATREEHRAVLPDHLEFLMDLERRGILFASGPMSAPEGTKPAFNGMTILRAASLAEVEATLAREPFVARGLRTYVIHAWDLNEGSFSVTLSFGGGTFAVP